MRRNIIVEKLIKEGLTETTLVKLTDKQLGQLAERMLGEDITTTAAAMQKSPQIQQLAKTPGQNIKLVGEESKKSKKCEHCGKDMTNCSCDDSHMDEELKGNQKRIDKNHNGKIDAEDFKLLNKEKQQTPKETKEGNKFSGELAKAKSQHKDSFNVDGKKYDVKEGLFGGGHKKVDTIKHDGHEIDVFTKGNEKVYGHPRKEGTKGKNDSERLVYSDLEGLKKSTSLMNKGEKNVNFPKSKKISNPDYKSTVVDTNESDMGLTIKGQKKNVSELLRFYDDDGNQIKDKKGKQSAVSTKDKDFEKKTKSKKCPHCGEHMKDCKCDDSHLEESRKVKNWVNNLAENNLYHSFTSKNEIMELIQTKLNESATMTHEFGPKVKQGHNGIPEFMTYDSIASSGPATAPTKPKPTVKPGQKPGQKPKTPYQPGPGPNHKPKALAEKKMGPATAPTKPRTKPTTKPGQKPKKDSPYSPKPGPNHKPKALAEKKDK
jgi:hypothetical protein